MTVIDEDELNTTIYYFTGTGNSLKIARDLAVNINNSELIPIAGSLRIELIIAETKKVGLVFPLYHYGIPSIIRDFIKKIDLKNTDYLFSVVTCYYISGIALEQVEELLSKKNKTLNAGFYVRMPTNFVCEHDPPSEDNQNKIFQKAAEKIKFIAEIVKQNKKHVDTKEISNSSIKMHYSKYSSAYDNWMELFDKNDSKFTVLETCKSCGTCVDVCPVFNVKLDRGYPRWRKNCEKCFSCINFCPNQAIQYGDETLNRGRYHHPDIEIKDLMNQRVLK
ncbi:MAG: EFR1 family ferrodoxin [Candidatus Hodarchaeales archaeon]|jgi:ferredoxin